MAYATPAELLAFVAEGTTLPSEDEQERLLQRASELIDEVTLGAVDAADDDEALAAENAACAQVEWWLEVGEQVDTSGPLQGYTIGSLQIQFGAGDNRVAPMTLAPRAKRFLFLAGLLARRVRVR